MALFYLLPHSQIRNGTSFLTGDRPARQIHLNKTKTEPKILADLLEEHSIIFIRRFIARFNYFLFACVFFSVVIFFQPRLSYFAGKKKTFITMKLLNYLFSVILTVYLFEFFGKEYLHGIKIPRTLFKSLRKAD